MHMLPQLRELERMHPDELVVIGVHSAKFMAEKATENLREAIVRYGVDHPVINDRDFKVWNEYAVRAWPTLLFVDPAGKLIAKHEGEAPVAALDRFVSQALDEYRAEGLIDTSRRLPVRAEQLDAGRLAFPGKVAAGPEGRIAVADTNHDRVVVADLSGRVERVLTGFDKPQGVAFGGGRLWVADTGHHSIRAVDLETFDVERVAGIDRPAMSGEDLAAGGLRSPWDVCWLDSSLYIAMAGSHQVWRHDPRSGHTEPWAGSGREGIQDGPLRDAWLAQPSGLSTDGRVLYVADSEVSGVRVIDPGPGTVRTLVGTGLFDFGDRDGPAPEVLLQHPLGVAAAAGAVYVADTLNGKVKRLDLAELTVTTVAAGFGEPGGLAQAGDRLLVADTNHHRLAALDLETGEVTEVELTGLQ